MGWFGVDQLVGCTASHNEFVLGNWAVVGKFLKKLQSVLNKLQNVTYHKQVSSILSSL